MGKNSKALRILMILAAPMVLTHALTVFVGFFPLSFIWFLIVPAIIAKEIRALGVPVSYAICYSACIVVFYLINVLICLPFEKKIYFYSYKAAVKTADVMYQMKQRAWSFFNKHKNGIKDMGFVPWAKRHTKKILKK
jgi:membrane-bound ClpP family serine protease